MKTEPAGNARIAAANLLNTVLEKHRAIGEAGAATAGLDARDRAFAHHLAYGVLRWYNALEWLAGRMLDKPLKQRDRDIQHLILIGIFQLWKEDGAPHAAVHASAESARQAGKNWAVGLINAVLRRFQRERDGLLESLDQQPQRFAHPDWLVRALREDWPLEWREILSANNQAAPMWLRVNVQKTSVPDYQALLGEAGLESRTASGVAEALLVSPAVPVERLPGFADGLVSVQDAAAQLAAGLLAPVSGERVLDACAAPGGKTCHLLESVPGIRLTAVDRQQKRIRLVRENLRRLGLECELRTGDAARPTSWWDGEPYDRILLDAPCSATGVIRRHPEIKWLRDPEQLQLAVSRQRLLLDRLWPLLKAGGILVYATCSILQRENSKQIHEFLSRHVGAQCIGPPGATDLPGRQILPGSADMDGFYYAVLRKPA
jgi:16S rRNA (cytosine967-C5)-methyltransferase